MQEKEKDALLVYLDWQLETMYRQFSQFIPKATVREELQDTIKHILLDIEVSLTHNEHYMQALEKKQVDKPE